MLRTESLLFQKITVGALADLIPYFKGKNAGISDMTIAYLHMWGDFLNTEYAIAGDTLFLRRHTRRGTYYYLPLVKGDDVDFMRGLTEISLLQEQGTVQLCAIPEKVLGAIKDAYTVSDIATSRDFADYVYHATDLATLAGKKYSKKRNLVHQFEKLYPNCTYEELSVENIEDAVTLLHHVMALNEENRDKMYENNRALEVLGDYAALPLTGGLLRVGGKAVAFCVGELIDDTLFVHIEKADREYKGAYQYMNRAYIQHELQKTCFSFVNREDDAGDEGLRQAKLSYVPAFLAYKYRVVIQNKG